MEQPWENGLLVFSVSAAKSRLSVNHPHPCKPPCFCVFIFSDFVCKTLVLHIFYKPSFSVGLDLILFALAALELLPHDVKSWLVVDVRVGV